MRSGRRTSVITPRARQRGVHGIGVGDPDRDVGAARGWRRAASATSRPSSSHRSSAEAGQGPALGGDRPASRRRRRGRCRPRPWPARGCPACRAAAGGRRRGARSAAPISNWSAWANQPQIGWSSVPAAPARTYDHAGAPGPPCRNLYVHPTARSTPAAGDVDLDGAGGVRQVPHRDRARRRGRGPSRPRCRRARRCGSRRPSARRRRRRRGRRAPRRTVAPGRPGDAGDDVAVGREVAGVDGDRAVAGERQGGVDELVQVDGRRVVDDDRAGGRADDRRQPVADPARAGRASGPTSGSGPPPTRRRRPRPAARARRAAPSRASCRRGRRARRGVTNRVPPRRQRVGGVERRRLVRVTRRRCIGADGARRSMSVDEAGLADVAVVRELGELDARAAAPARPTPRRAGTPSAAAGRTGSRRCAGRRSGPSAPPAGAA